MAWRPPRFRQWVNSQMAVIQKMRSTLMVIRIVVPLSNRGLPTGQLRPAIAIALIIRLCADLALWGSTAARRSWVGHPRIAM